MKKTTLIVAALLTCANMASQVHAAPDFHNDLAKTAGNLTMLHTPHVAPQNVGAFTNVVNPSFLTKLGMVKVPQDPEIVANEIRATQDHGKLVLVSSGDQDRFGINTSWRVYEGKASDGSLVQMSEYASMSDGGQLSKDLQGYSLDKTYQGLAQIDDSEGMRSKIARFAMIGPVAAFVSYMFPVSMTHNAVQHASHKCEALDAKLDKQHLSPSKENALLSKAGCSASRHNAI